MRSIVYHLLAHLPTPIAENLPADLIARCGLPGRDQALREIHFPGEGGTIEDYNQSASDAHRRLIFEEFFWLAIALGIRREDRVREPKGERIELTERVREAVRAILPFALTAAQRRVVGEIVSNMAGDEPMNRLLQGDVGSGKTIGALQAMVVAIENGYQTALMAPTEILAEQHARTITRLVLPSGTATSPRQRASPKRWKLPLMPR